MIRLRCPTPLLASLLVCFAAMPAFAAETPPTTGTLIDFQAQAELTAPNDLGRASAYVEASGPNPSELSRKVNKVLADALVIAKRQTEVKVKSGGTHTYPVYGKGNRTIEGWRMRSEILLESRDAAALSELLGKLQATLAVGNLSFSPSTDTRRTIEDEATLDAIARFQEKATRYAAALKKTYRIRSLNVQSNSAQPTPMYRGMALMAASDAAPMPVEAGDSTVTVVVSGQIELNN